ncbi:MAG: PAS domain S-box protein, partial [Chloroflexi bacterium]
MDDQSREAASGTAVSDLKRHLADVKREAQQAVSAGWDAGADPDGDLYTLLRETRALLSVLFDGVSGTWRPGEIPAQSEDLATAFEELQLAEEELRVQNDELIEAHHALDAERRRYQELFDFAPDGSLVTDFSGVVQEANRAAALLLGVERAFLVGKPLALYVAEPDQERLFRNLQSLQRDEAGASLRWETSMRSLQGVPFEASLAVAPVCDEQGKRAGLRWLIRDVTEAKRMQEALRESEERYRSLFNSMSEGFALHEIVCDAKGRPYDYRFLAVNPAFEALTGFKGENVQGKRVLEVLPSIEPFWIETYGRVALTGEPAHFEQRSGILGRDYEVLAYCPAEKQFVSVVPATTERRRAAEMLRQQAEELQQLTESLEQRVQERTAELASAVAGLQTEMYEPKRAEAAVRAERQRFNDILEILPAYVALLTPDYHATVANRFFRERFGEAHGRRCYEFLFERDEPCEACETYSVLKTGQPHHWEWVGPDGHTYDVFDFPFTDS